MSLRRYSETVIRSVNINEFLIVACATTHFAIPADAVRSVIRPDEGNLTELLSALGVTGSPTHLAEQFGLTGSYLSPDARIVVCRRQAGHHAFRVDRVLGLHEIDAAKIKPLLPHFTGSERQWIVGMFLFQQTVALIVNTHWLLATERTRPFSGAAAGSTRRAGALVPSGQAAGVQTSSEPFTEFEVATDGDDAPWADI
jgi:chemotaxis protein histidine kinase CheA